MSNTEGGHPWRYDINTGDERFEIYMFGETDQRIANLGAPIFALMFCKQADPMFHHRGYSLVVIDIRILPR